MNIKWNEVTWYSKLAAIIFLIGVFPVVTFYIGTQYQATLDVISFEAPDSVQLVPINDVTLRNTDNVFRNADNAFEIQYPKEFVLSEDDEAEFNKDPNLLYRVTISNSYGYQKGTDLDTAYIQILASTSTATCLIDTSNWLKFASSTMIHGMPFYYNPEQPFSGEDIMGVSYFYSFYAGIRNDKCYRIIKEIDYYTDKYSRTPLNLPHFDEKKVNADLDKIIASLVIKDN